MNKLGQFNVKVDAILNGLEKDIAFTININLTFIDSKEFLNSNLERLVKNLSDNDFKYVT